jgi:hypothetical protein
MHAFGSIRFGQTWIVELPCHGNLPILQLGFKLNPKTKRHARRPAAA